VITKHSAAGFAETVNALTDAIERRGLTVFARVDHAAGAREAGLELEDEQVVLFGNPRSGTPLMQDDRRIGIELPLRILVWSQGDDVRVGYNDPRGLAPAYDVKRTGRRWTRWRLCSTPSQAKQQAARGLKLAAARAPPRRATTPAPRARRAPH
jgi:uncharacterized protein (DUF302 family)